jgi:FkbM family methyltransferase
MDEITFHQRLHRPGVMLDIGAHDGLLTAPFAALPRSRVIAFEPLPSAHGRLQARFTPCPAHVELRREALGAAPGAFTLSVPVVNGVTQEQWASIAKDYQGFSEVSVQQHEVRVTTLDALALSGLTHVKLDVEGAEYEALQGGRATLLRERPVLSVEIEERHREGSTYAVPAYLDALGYDGFWWWDGAMRAMAEFDRARFQRANPSPAVFEHIPEYVFVFFFLPREHAAAMLAKL